MASGDALEERIRRYEALQKLCRDLFARNLIGTDFEDVQARHTVRRFEQDEAGVTFQFCVSHHALGKIDPYVVEEVFDAFGLSDNSYYVDHSSMVLHRGLCPLRTGNWAGPVGSAAGGHHTGAALRLPWCRVV